MLIKKMGVVIKKCILLPVLKLLTTKTNHNEKQIYNFV